MTTKPFEVGKTYPTLDGKPVTIVAENNEHPGYECVQGDDWESATGGWRYNRPQDRGRVTGLPRDFVDPRNLVPDPE